MGFKAADQQPLDIVAGINKRVLIVERGQMSAATQRLHVGKRFGQYVEMLASIERHMRAGHRGHFAGPETAGDDHLVSVDHMLAHLDTGNTANLFPQPGNARIFEEFDIPRACALGQGQRHV